MHKKSQPTLRSRIGVFAAAFTLAAGLGLAFVAAPTPALAEEAETSTEPADEWVTSPKPLYDTDPDEQTNSKGGSVIVAGGKTKTYYDDVNTQNTTAVVALSDSTLTVNGNVSVTGDGTYGEGSYAGVYAQNSTVTVNGDVSATGSYDFGVDAEGSTRDSTVTVNGDVNAKGLNSKGVFADNSTVTVNGDVSADGVLAVGVGAFGGSVTVNGSVTVTGRASFGVYTSDEGSNTVVVKGDVSAENGAYADSSSTLVVEGTLRGEDTALYLDYAYNTTVVVGRLETGDGGTLINDLSAEPGHVSAAVNYIVQTGGFSVLGTTSLKVADTIYNVAHEGDKLTLTLLSDYKIGEYTFITDSGYTWKDNGDGTYTVTVGRGGGLTFVAESPNLSQLTRASSAGEGASSTKTASASATDVIAPRETLPATGDATGASVLGLAVLAGAAAVGAGAHLRCREE